MSLKRPEFVHVRIKLFGVFEKLHQFVDKYDFSVFFNHNTTLTLTRRALPLIYSMSLLYKWKETDIRLNVKNKDSNHIEVFRDNKLYFSFDYDKKKNRYDNIIDLIEKKLWRQLMLKEKPSRKSLWVHF
jgi:hypothetical protein